MAVAFAWTERPRHKNPHHSPAPCEPFPGRVRCQQGWFIPTLLLGINTSRQASICCSVAPCSGCGTGFYHKSSSSHKKAEARDYSGLKFLA